MWTITHWVQNGESLFHFNMMMNFSSSYFPLGPLNFSAISQNKKKTLMKFVCWFSLIYWCRFRLSTYISTNEISMHFMVLLSILCCDFIVRSGNFNENLSQTLSNHLSSPSNHKIVCSNTPVGVQIAFFCKLKKIFWSFEWLGDVNIAASGLEVWVIYLSNKLFLVLDCISCHNYFSCFFNKNEIIYSSRVEFKYVCVFRFSIIIIIIIKNLKLFTYLIFCLK